MFTVGDRKLMPEPDYSSIVINAKSGYLRENNSWVIGRVLRDFDYWKPKTVEIELEKMLDDARQADKAKEEVAGRSLEENGVNVNPTPNRRRVGLCISVFATSSHRRAGADITKTGFSTVASLPPLFSWVSLSFLGLYGQWSILIITICAPSLHLRLVQCLSGKLRNGNVAAGEDCDPHEGKRSTACYSNCWQ